MQAAYEVDGYLLGKRGDTYVADGRARLGLKRTSLGEFKNEDDARSALHQFVDARKVLAQRQAQHTIGKLWDMWMVHRETDGFPNDIYKANWATLGPYFSNRSPVTLTEEDCRVYARQRFAAGRAPATVHTELVRIRACLSWALKRRHIAFAPLVWAPSRGKPRSRVLSANEAHALLIAAYDELHVYVFTVLGLTTAARHMAILDLRWDRIDFVTGIIDYEVDLAFDPMRKSYTKGRAQVPMNELARAALMRAYAVRQTDFVVEYRGKRLQTIRASFGLALARAGLAEAIPVPNQKYRVRTVSDVTPHILRHSVNTWLQENGVDAERRAKLLGQRDVRTNQLVYSHGSPARMLTEAVGLIDTEMARRTTSTEALEVVEG